MTLPFLVLLVKITCVLLVALGITLLMQRASAGSRHLVWLLALGALLLLPPLAAWAPLRLPVLPEVVPAVAAQRPSPGVDRQQPVIGQHDRTTAADAPTSASTTVPARPSLPGAGTILLGVWLLAVLLLVARLAYGTWSVRRIVRRARVLDDPSWQVPLYEIADRLGLDEAPQLLQSSDVKMPFASGFMSPTIVLPAESESWSADRRTAVLVHELGHVRRRDLIGHTMGRIVCALYWFHPLVWTAARRLRAESEQACDDLALVFGARPSEYAEHLLDIVTCVRDHNTPSVALAMAHRKEFEGRMLAILNPELRRRGPGRAGVATYACALAGLVFLIGAATPVPRAAGQPESRLGMDQGTAQVPAGTRADPAPKPAPEPAAHPEAGRDQNSSVSDRIATETSTRVNTDVSTHTNVNMSLGMRIRLSLSGNSPVQKGDTAVVRALIARLGDENAQVRRAAARALGRIGEPMAIPALVKALDDSDREVQEAALDALSDFESGVPVAPVQRMLASSNPDMRERAIEILANMRARSAQPAIAALVADANADVRQRAIQAMQRFGDPASARAIMPALADNSADVRQSALQALSELGGSIPDATLAKLLADTNEDVRQAAVQYIAERRITGMAPQLVRLLDDSSADVRQSALQALSELDGTVPDATLTKLLADPKEDVRQAATQYVAERRIASMAPQLLNLLNDNSSDVRQSAIQALSEIGGSIPDATLTRLLHDSSDDVRQAAVQYIQERRITSMTPELIRLLDDESGDVRESAAQALTEVRTPESHAALQKALNNSDPDVRRTAVQYLGEDGDKR